ncbi:MAG: heme ABC exporter ATP-binding protein CcmA [Bryobacteraceae bacterium]|nr:heme ABC exporter ATP-binding protein CcmA [Bryobacteraceae bacterium]
MAEPLVAADGVWRFFGDFAALREVTCSASAGECIALLGPNGAGKTTLLKLLARLAKPQKGGLRLPAPERVGYLGHGLGLWDELSARENLRFWANAYRAPASAAETWLARVELDHVADAPVRQFSRGMRQRVALGRAFLHSPDLLVLDEPFTGLDARSVTLLQAVLREALARRATVVVSSHQIPEVMELATQSWKLERGRLQSGVTQ